VRVARITTILGLIIGVAVAVVVLIKPEEKGNLTHTAAANTQRTVAQGDVIGFHADNSGHAWLGIPYAKPPVGNLRWKAPQAPLHWEGVLQATSMPQMCSQLPRTSTPNEHEKDVMLGGEDCLYLNVFAPSDARERSTPLPVMVWIHGGGNLNGEGTDLSSARLPVDYDVIVVSLNYRMGPLGWMAHQGLRDEGEASPNFANLDHIAALEWVHDNIRSFGGDPGRVTVFGQSAGAANTLSLFQNPLAKGLFHGAISQSGGMRTQSMAAAENYADAVTPGFPASSSELPVQIAIQNGDAVDREQAKEFIEAMTPGQVIAYLRKEPAPALFKTILSLSSSGYQTAMTIRDGIVIQDADPRDILSDLSRTHHIPIIFGTTWEENKLYQLIDPAFTRVQFGFYRTILDEPYYDAFAQNVAKARKITGVDSLAELLSSAGKTDVYAFRFDWDEQATILFMDYSKLLGAAHVVDVDFVHGNFAGGGPMDRLYTKQNKVGRDFLAEAMMSYWSEFAHTGKPGKGLHGELPLWSPWQSEEGTDKYIIFDSEAGGGLRMAQDRMTPSRLLNEIASDTRLADDAAKCAVIRHIERRGKFWSTQELAPYSFASCARLVGLE
jgi:para-nitrobenzyl esterase